MKISIAYVTGRREPMFQWFVESLISQYPDGKVTDEIIFVDGWLDYSTTRRQELADIVAGRFSYIHTPPKPSIWRGKHRKTRRNFYDGSGSKNTAFVVMSTEYCLIMDDLCFLFPGLVEAHRKAAREQVIFSGQYIKANNIVWKDGIPIEWSTINPDCRAPHHIDKTKWLKSGGGWVFGSNSGYPLEAILATGGHDEFLARVGGDDCDMGVRFDNAGWGGRIFYDSTCAYVEDQDLHYTGPNEVDNFYCLRKIKTEEETDENKAHIASIKAHFDAVTHPRLYQQRCAKPADPHFNLEAERALYRATGGFKAVDHIGWTDPDGQDISEI